MACEICGRGSCTRSFHSLSEQEEFDNPISPEDKIAALEARVRELEAALHAKENEMRRQFEIDGLRAQLAAKAAEVGRITADRDLRRERQYAEMLEWRGINDADAPCKSCGGAGRKAYGSTSTWRGGGGGQMITVDVCDACWGSGIANKPWPSWRKTIARDAEVAGLRDALAEAFRYLDEDGDTTRAYNALRAALKP